MEKLKVAIALLAALAFFLLALGQRYEIVATSNPRMSAYRLDKWTGGVLLIDVRQTRQVTE